MSMRKRSSRSKKLKNTPLTSRMLKIWLTYDPMTGIFRRNKDSTYGRQKIGMIAGGINKQLGYRQISVCANLYYAHRLAWLYMTNKWPCVEIDHVNGIRDDNRWNNLRQATYPQQRRNRKSIGTNSGYKGVWKHPNGRFYSSITVNYKQIYLGGFSSAEKAHTAYCEAATKYFGRYARFE